MLYGGSLPMALPLPVTGRCYPIGLPVAPCTGEASADHSMFRAARAR